MSNGVRLEGFDDFKRKLQAGAGVPAKAHAIVTDLTYKWKELSIKSAPVNHGRLRSGISATISPINATPIVGEVYSPALYSPYMEWGTITKVNVPSSLQSYALQFKGRGIRKRGGVNPRPFFFIHKDGIEAELKKRLKNLFK